jgi:UDP-glucose:(heptosyl)LPS alpha-1,3-glucosyltransferase
VRVAVVVERFDARGGGVEHVAWQVAHGLAKAGDDVTVVARAAAPGSSLRVERIAVADAWQPWRVLAFSRAAARAAPRGRFDVVQSFSRTRHQDVFRTGGGTHADYLERSHGPLARAARRLSPRHRVLLGIEARVFADPTQTILCNSRLVRDSVARRYGVADDRLAIVHNGVDLARFHPDRRGEASALRAELGGAAGPLWLFVGSGFARKGLDTALRALAAAPGVLLVAGRDEPSRWRARADALGVGARVRWLGARDDVERLCAAADAFVLPTRYDAFANACLEAAAAGLPVVTSRSNGAAEVLGEGGVAIERADDVEGFAAALVALTAPGARATRGAAARAAAERLSWDAHIAALRALFARIRT